MQSRLLLLSLILPACVEPLTATHSAAADTDGVWTLRLEPEATFDEAQQVLVFHLEAEGKEAASPPEALALVEGSPSSVSLGKYEDGETTESLAERIIPSELVEEVNHIQLRAKGLLALGQTYTLISEKGVLGVVTIAPRSEPTYLARVWPPVDSAYTVEQAVFCGERAPSGRQKVELFPPGHYGHIELGLDSDGALDERCIRLVLADRDVEGLMPPIRMGDFALEPTPFGQSLALSELPLRSCERGQVQLGPGCFAVEGERGIITGPNGMTFWAIESAAGFRLATLDAGQRFVVPNLAALSQPRLAVTVFDLAGRSLSDAIEFTLPAPSPRVVINEVMANPLGAEPAEEWVELTNAGAAQAELFGYRLADGGGQVDLPSMVLEPGAFVLLAREDFVGGQAGDVAPGSDVAIVRLPQLGKSGLTNSGEALQLLDASGGVVSAFPAIAADRAGTSVARRDPSVLDDDSQGFVSHASPGASPGAPNQLE
jgi:hypothetical protein